MKGNLKIPEKDLSRYHPNMIKYHRIHKKITMYHPKMIKYHHIHKKKIMYHLKGERFI